MELLESVSRDGLVFVGDPGWLRHRLLEARHSAVTSCAGFTAAATGRGVRAIALGVGVEPTRSSAPRIHGRVAFTPWKPETDSSR